MHGPYQVQVARALPGADDLNGLRDLGHQQTDTWTFPLLD